MIARGRDDDHLLAGFDALLQDAHFVFLRARVSVVGLAHIRFTFRFTCSYLRCCVCFRSFYTSSLSDGVGCKIARCDEDLVVLAATAGLAELHVTLDEKVSRLLDLINKSSEGLAEKATPKVTEVMKHLTSLATPMTEALGINAKEATTVLEELGMNCFGGLKEEIFDKHKVQLQQSVEILNRLHLYSYM